ncbi:DUF4240 domain-containing protein [Lentzea tibetensis]|uniref:DUF4240 domain-containing protein n=1 Tax=Lentzea tibetensis TaxID=2591470 RepID=A0A563ERM5_9PSEU|nr:DUF4240 domain-containing protein [Lentzea tibetensis]TWP49511.1 DUF4240 domain-containing protein [Lentzea tibetensis]
MDMSAFWGLVERSRDETPDQDERLEWLTDALAGLPPGDIADFQVHFDRLRSRVDTWDHWAAAAVVCDGLCSDDGFFYFQAWLVGLGPEVFERVAASADALAAVPAVVRLAGLGEVDAWEDADWPDWESLDYVAGEAFRRATGQEEGLERLLEARGHSSRSSPDPVGVSWDFDDPAEVRGRLPRLSELFLGEKVA